LRPASIKLSIPTLQSFLSILLIFSKYYYLTESTHLFY